MAETKTGSSDYKSLLKQLYWAEWRAIRKRVERPGDSVLLKHAARIRDRGPLVAVVQQLERARARAAR